MPGISLRLSFCQMEAQLGGKMGHSLTLAASDAYAAEVVGERFEFGKNWQGFLSVLDESRIDEAMRSLEQMLGRGALAGRSFIDMGSGSGLFSLAAIRLGATPVHSLDIDPRCVACTLELKRRYFPRADYWTVERASVLDERHLEALGRWDVVYSWGVLHHTGDMWKAMAHLQRLVAPDGRLFIALYNDQGLKSRVWRVIKRIYNLLPPQTRPAFVIAVMAPREAVAAGVEIIRLRPMAYVRRWTDYKQSRGMSRWHDLVDWVGGYPFEVAKPDDVFRFYRDHGFQLRELVTRTSGCNEYVFTRAAPAPRRAGSPRPAPFRSAQPPP
jgi:2-polyprenyl-3-methyl-5-hydroxy-6-metoxy-1,4-benzoquinol methylase